MNEWDELLNEEKLNLIVNCFIVFREMISLNSDCWSDCDHMNHPPPTPRLLDKKWQNINYALTKKGVCELFLQWFLDWTLMGKKKLNTRVH